MIYLCFISLISVLIVNTISDNIDTKFPIVFTQKKSRNNQNINDSYFGYSLSVNQQNDENFLLIGSPKHNSQLYPRAERTGAIFHCKWKDSQTNGQVFCDEINFSEVNRINPSKNMNLGSTLASNSHSFVGCAHLWVNTEEALNSPTPLGKCYRISNQGQVIQSFGPNPSTRLTTVGRPLNSHLMTGFSSIASQTEDSYILGAPGYRDFSGSIIRQLMDVRDEQVLELEKVLDVFDSRLPSLNSYLGYAITTGFFDNNLEYIVMGAPRHNHFTGKVLIYPLSDLSQRRKNNFKNYLIEVNGKSEAKGEYFGASLLALDLNNDKFDDLIVGAPFYSNERNREIGRIYVFLMNDKGTEFIKEELREGHKSGGRFGTALSSIDINLDGYKDAIISAPYETNGDGSMGAVYIYLGSKQGIDSEPQMRIGAESMKNVVLNGFGISIVSNHDLDFNGYNDLLIGSYLSENVVLIRSKPIANLSISDITFKPNKIRLNDKKCNNNQNSCFKVEYCVQYSGQHIRDKQLAVISLDITDSKIRIRENRVKINGIKTENKSIELRANQRNCFTNDKSFLLLVNDPEYLIDIITSIEIKLSVKLTNESTNSFCKDCPIARSHSSLANIDFEHGCQSRNCLSRLVLNAIPKYSGQRIERNLIEGLHDTIDVEISVANSGEAAINTFVVIKMSPILLELTNSADADRCRPVANMSAYRCDVSRILQKGKKENLNLHFIVSRIPTNNIEISFKVESSSTADKGSKLSDYMKLEIIRQANLMLLSETTNNFSFSDKTPKVSFQVSYSLLKSGPSSINFAFIQLRLPVDIIVPDRESQNICEQKFVGNRYKDIPIVNKTLNLICDKTSEYCSTYLCQLQRFNSGAYSQPFILSLALIPSKIKNKEFKEIYFKLNSEIKIGDKVKFETEITSFASMSIFMARDVPIIDEKVEPWVLFLSAGFGVFILIITVIILIKYGFFRRKKLEEIEKVKQRMSIKPEMFDINVLDLDEEDLNE